MRFAILAVFRLQKFKTQHTQRIMSILYRTTRVPPTKHPQRDKRKHVMIIIVRWYTAPT